MSDDPQIPVKYSEMLYVSMAAALEEVQKAGYPTENLSLVLEAYAKSRDTHLLARGWTEEQIKIEQAAAIDAVTLWLEEREIAPDTLDFAAWQQELEEEDDRT